MKLAKIHQRIVNIRKDSLHNLKKRQLEYKSKLKGNFLNIIDRWFSSSKKCSNCGIKKDKLSLSEKTYICNKCGLEINIHNQLPIACREVKPVEI